MRASLTKAAGWLRVRRSEPRQQPHHSRGQNDGPSKCGACAFGKIDAQNAPQNVHKPFTTINLKVVVGDQCT
jgi:hypothetical protein